MDPMNPTEYADEYTTYGRVEEALWTAAVVVIGAIARVARLVLRVR